MAPRKFANGGVTTTALWESLRPNYAWAEQVPKDDSRIKTEHLNIDSPQGNGKVEAYLARPAHAASASSPWSWWFTRTAVAPPTSKTSPAASLWPTSSPSLPMASPASAATRATKKKASSSSAKVDKPKMTEDFLASACWLKARPDSNGKLGAVGFCFGGGMANALAVLMGPDLNAAVPFYGSQPKAEDAAKIKAPLLLHYASLDARITGNWPAWEEAPKANHDLPPGTSTRGANHGFQPTTPHPVTTNPPPNWPGSAPSISSINT